MEQLVGNNVWNTTVIGSVTLGLIESYMNNETLEIFTSNGYTFIKHADDNSTLLFLDLETGIVRDYFSDYGLLGTMPCYHDNITENAWRYGNNILNPISKENKELKNIITASISNKFNNEIFEFFSEMFKDFDALKFIDDLIIGIVGSEIASVGVIIAAVASMTNPEIFLAGISIF